MKKVGVVIILILVISMLFACNAHNHNMLYDLVACGSFAVPGMMCADLKGDSYSCTVMETDQQGRIMFSYTTVNTITNKEETAIVICQRIEENRVYYYEDVCFLLGNSTAEMLSTLKRQNDWNLPLDFGKMTAKDYTISFDLYLINKAD